MRTKKTDLRTLLVEALNMQTKKWFVDQHADFYGIKKVLAGEEVRPATAEKIRVAAELALTLPPNKNIRPSSLEALTEDTPILHKDGRGVPSFRPAPEVLKKLKAVVKKSCAAEVSRATGICVSSMRRLLNGTPVNAKTLNRLGTFLAEDPKAPKLKKSGIQTSKYPALRKLVQLRRNDTALVDMARASGVHGSTIRDFIKGRPISELTHMRLKQYMDGTPSVEEPVVEEAPVPKKVRGPNVRPDLIRAIICAINPQGDPAIADFLAMREKYGAEKVDSIISLAARLAEEGYPIDVLSGKARP